MKASLFYDGQTIHLHISELHIVYQYFPVIAIRNLLKFKSIQFAG